MPLSMPPLRPLLLKFITLPPPPPARAALASTLGLLCRHRLVQLTKPASTLGLLCPLVAPTFWRPQSTPLLPRTRPSALRHQVVKSWQLSIAAPPSTFFSVAPYLQTLKRHTLPSQQVSQLCRRYLSFHLQWRSTKHCWHRRWPTTRPRTTRLPREDTSSAKRTSSTFLARIHPAH
jgi:hypothetical protein